MSRHFKQWLTLASAGLLTIGLGVSFLGHATIEKNDDQLPFWRWIVSGTLGIAFLNAGVSMVGDAVKHRVMYEIETEA